MNIASASSFAPESTAEKSFAKANAADPGLWRDHLKAVARGRCLSSIRPNKGITLIFA
jgi:hypothetical protein